MDYLIDRRINLTDLWRRCEGRSIAIRHELIRLGLGFAEANQFTMFATYGFHGPREKQTLNFTNKNRLGILCDFEKPRRKEPPAWNRP